MRVRAKKFTTHLMVSLLKVLLLQAIIALACLYALKSMSGRVLNDDIPAIRLLGEIDAQTTADRLLSVQYLLVEAPGQRLKIRNELRQRSLDLDRDFSVLETHVADAGENRSWQQFKANWTSYILARNALLARIDDGRQVVTDQEAAGALYLRATEKLHDIITVNDQINAHERAAARRSYDNSLAILVGATILSVVLVIKLRRYLNRRVSAPLTELTVAMQSMATGDLDRPISDRAAPDEIRGMTAALGSLREALMAAEQRRREDSALDAANLRLMNEAQSALDDYAELLNQQVIGKTQRLTEAEREIIWRLSRATERRDNETGHHIMRMSLICGFIAEGLGLAKDKCREIEIASQMHDIGKVGIPDAILFKPGAFTPEERKIMETHVQLGWDILSGSESPLIQCAAEIALSHHERWDGTGYPNGLAGEEIPLSARIAAVADVFDALTSARTYKRVWPSDEAIAYLSANSGTHFDPCCVDAFMSRVGEILATTQPSVPSIDMETAA